MQRAKRNLSRGTAEQQLSLVLYRTATTIYKDEPMRVSLKKHHRKYLDVLAQQMGCDAATALDYAFWELKRIGFSFSSSLPPVSVSSPTHGPLVPSLEPPNPPGAFVRFEEVKPEAISSATEDELIVRLVAAGLEQF
jgi:hypothetical protein